MNVLTQLNDMAVDVMPGNTLRASRAATFLSSWPYAHSVPVTPYDVLRDGSFIVSRRTDALAPNARITNRIGEIHVVLNFLDERYTTWGAVKRDLVRH